MSESARRDDFVLDASAVLCLLKNETGAERVATVLNRSCISTVNLAEVYGKLADAGGSRAKIARAIDALALIAAPFDAEQAYSAGLMRPITKALGLSLGDRACLALARRLGSTALTADRSWMDVALDIGVAVEVIR